MTATKPVPATADTPAKPKRRVLRWVFIAVSALFLIAIIAGAAGSDSEVAARPNRICGSRPSRGRA
jgi:hypothetical protein